jgi:glutamate-1-semialdehyde aminotransferase
MAIAVRIARAASGRDHVAVAGYHGWHDWYLSANLDEDALHGLLLPQVPVAGVPRALAKSVATIPFGDEAALEALADRHGRTLAAIVIEPARYTLASKPYLERARQLADRLGAVLLFDEITSGFRMAVGGAHLLIGVDPDIAVFAKGMSNGYPMAAVIGRRAVMEALERTFVSSTYWTERIGPTAALATIRKLREMSVPVHLAAMGDRMRAGWIELASRHGLRMTVRGVSVLPSFAFDHGSDSAALHTLYTQCMLDDGFLAGSAFHPCFAHEPRHVDGALEATDRAFATLGGAIARGAVRSQLRGPVAFSGLRGPRD